MSKSNVYFSREITPEKVLEMYKILNKNLEGNVAVKVHSGEKGNPNFLRPPFFKPIVDHVKGTIVECNTAYQGSRNSTEKHTKLMSEHGWSKLFKVDILDSQGPDLKLDMPYGKIINYNLVGKNLKNYNSMLVLSHFKGHAMGGYGGALKQLSIGVASSAGKTHIHSAGKTQKQEELFENFAKQEHFLQAMAESAKSVVDYMNSNVAYINVMCNMAINCDCAANADGPVMKDIGILSSLDPVALDQACVDLVYSSNDPGKKHLIERIESRKGLLTIEFAEKLGLGSKEYQLIEV